MEMVLAVATILGGIAAVWFFWDKLRNKESSWVGEVKKLAQKNPSEGDISIVQQTSNNTFMVIRVEHISSRAASGPTKVMAIISVPALTLEDGYNVSSLVDHGTGDVSVIFVHEFANSRYLVRVSGDATIQYRLVEKSAGHLRLKLEESGLKRVQVECEEVP